MGEAVRRECVAADDEITALAVMMKSSIEKEKGERKHVENHINSQIDSVKQELIDQRGAHDNECSRLMGFVKNLEEQLSTHVTHVEELRFNHEAEVNKRLDETTETRCSLQRLEGRSRVDLQDGKKVLHALVVTTEQELVKQKDVCLAETIELRQGFERRLELLREESFQVGNEAHDK